MLRIAFATRDRIAVNQHFGASSGFTIYALDEGRAHLVEVVEFPPGSMDGNEVKLAERIAALAGCHAVYCLAIGGSAIRQLLARGIQPVRLEEVSDIEVLLGGLQRAVRSGGVAWIDSQLRRLRDGERFERMLEEGWRE